MLICTYVVKRIQSYLWLNSTQRKKIKADRKSQMINAVCSSFIHP